MSTPLEYTLKFPVELRNTEGAVVETITRLSLRRLKGRDMKVLDKVKGEGSASLALVAAMADVPPSTVDQLDFADITALLQLFESFTGGSLPTGARS